MEQELIKQTTPNFNDERLNDAVNYMRIANNDYPYQEPPAQASDTFNPLATGGANPSAAAMQQRRNSAEERYGSASKPSLQ